MKKLMLLCTVLFLLLARVSVAKAVFFKTNNKIPVTFINSSTKQFIDLALVFPAGSAYDQEKHGLAKLTHDLMLDGAGQWQGVQLRKQFADVGARIDGGVNRELSWWHLRSLNSVDVLSAALKAFSVMLSDPLFADDDFARLRDEQVASMRAVTESAGAIASNAFMKNLFAGTAYAHSVLGSEKTLDNINEDDVKQFYSDHYNSTNASLIIIGDLTTKQAKQFANAAVKGMPKGSAVKALRAAPKLSKQKMVNVNIPSKQTHIIIGQVGVSRRNPDYFPLLVANESFGGGMTSQLFREVRNRRGLAYSVGSYVIPAPYGGVFMINLQTKNSSASQALKLVEKLLQNWVKTTPSDKLLQKNKMKLAGSFLVALDSNAAIIQQWIYISGYHLPQNYLDTYVKNIRAVTPQQVSNALQKQIDLNKLLIVKVGPVTSEKIKSKSKKTS